MALITLRIIDGPDRGKEFRQIAAPIAVGREEGNQIQLNDQRVSRNHLKIYEISNAILLTDLQSTNGTKVNGESVHTWHLQPGDFITVGRTQLVFGSASEIANRLAVLKTADLSGAVPMGLDDDERQMLQRLCLHNDPPEGTASAMSLAKELFRDMDTALLEPLQMLIPPLPPNDLLPQQSAKMEAFLLYIHIRLRYLLATVRSNTAPGDQPENFRITLSAAQWQNLVDLHSRITSVLLQ